VIFLNLLLKKKAGFLPRKKSSFFLIKFSN